MAGYWTASVLSPYLVRPNMGSVLITSSSIPVNLSIFQAIIDEISGEFDQAAAKAGYVVPIPSTASGYLVAQRVVRNGATADVLRIIYTGPDQKYVDRFQAAYDNQLKQIEDGDRPIVGAPLDPGDDGRLLPAWNGIASGVITATMGYPQDLGVPNDF